MEFSVTKLMRISFAVEMRRQHVAGGVRALWGVAGRRGWGCDPVSAVSVTARDLRLQSRLRPEIELAYLSLLSLSEPKPHFPELHAKVAIL